MALEAEARTYDDLSKFQSPLQAIEKFTFEIDESSIQTLCEIGEGAFGNVSCGVMKVAVKTRKIDEDDADDADAEFLKEAAIMGQFKHPNVIRLIGVTRTKPFLIVTELVENGSLDKFLTKHRIKEDITMAQQLKMMKDIASGMNYLSEMGYIHRDLAARNILINKHWVCKVTDFGLSRYKNEDGTYGSKKGIFPIRWTAPEAFETKTFTSGSDVWSFGIVMWEIMSYGETPYNNLDNEDVIDHVLRGARLPHPRVCPPFIYDLMWGCWIDERERPPFSLIVARLDDIIKSVTEHVL